MVSWWICYKINVPSTLLFFLTQVPCGVTLSDGVGHSGSAIFVFCFVYYATFCGYRTQNLIISFRFLSIMLHRYANKEVVALARKKWPQQKGKSSKKKKPS